MNLISFSNLIIKKIALSVFILLTFQSLQSQDLSLNYIDVSDNVVMLHNEKPEGSNVTCIALEDGLVFIDCSLFTEIARKFREDMEKRFKKKTIALLITHAHTDHFFGMGAFKDVTVIASKESQEIFLQQLKIDFSKYVKSYEGVFPRFGEALKTANLFAPLIWLEQKIQIGNQEDYILFERCGGHTIGSSYVFYPKENILIAGDNLQVDYHPYFGDKSGNISEWIKSLQEWEAINPIKICPGHGKPVDVNYLKETRIYFEKLISVLEELKGQGLKPKEVVNHKKLPNGYWPEDLERPGWFNYSIALIYNKIKI